MPFAIRSWGSDLSTKSDSDRTSRDDASHAPGGGVPLQLVPSAHSVTQTAPSFSLVAAGNSVVATSALATGTGTWLGFAMWNFRSKETIIALGEGAGPNACWQMNAPAPSGAETSCGQ